MSTVNESTEKVMTEDKINDADDEGNGLEKPRKVSEANVGGTRHSGAERPRPSEAKLNAIKKAQEARKVKAKERAEQKQKEEEKKIAQKYIAEKKQVLEKDDSSSESEEEQIIIKRPKKKQTKKKPKIIYVSDESDSESEEEEPPKPKAPPRLKREKAIVEKIEYKQEQAQPKKLTWDSIRWA
jgi:hypothetical protein